MAWERVFHGNPSGVTARSRAAGDASSSRERRGSPRCRSGRRSRSASDTPAHRRAPPRWSPGWRSCAPTRASAVEAAFDGIHGLVASSRLALETGDRRGLGRLMELNQIWLGDLGLSTPAIDRMCKLAREHGAFGSKLTGAGGGGSVVALVNGGHGAWQVLHAWRGAGFEGFVTRVAAAESLIEERELPRVGNLGRG